MRLINIIRDRDTAPSRILRRNLAFEMIRPLKLTLGDLILESLVKPWEAKLGFTRLPVKEFIDSLEPKADRTTIKENLKAINDLRTLLLHFSEVNKFTDEQRVELVTRYQAVVDCWLFKMIFKEEEGINVSRL